MSPRASSYIRIRNWDRYQHYGKRRPPWIKLHVELLEKRETMALPVATRWFAIALLLIAARTDNVIESNMAWLARETKLTLHQTEKAIKELLAIRFVEPLGQRKAEKELASTMLAERYPSRARTRSASASSSLERKEQPQTQELMAYFCERVNKNGDFLTSRARGMTAKEIGKLVKEGVPDDLIRRALELQADRGKSPNILPLLVQEVQVEGRGKNGRGRNLSAADILAMPFEEES